MTKAIHIYRKSGRKRKEASGLGPVPQEETWQKRGTLGTQRSSLGSELFEDLLAGLKTSGTYRWAAGDLDSAHEECA